MPGPLETVETYFRAKDGNRPFLMRRAFAPDIDLEMLVETDAPFLAPVPHRGQKCEPAFVADTAAFVADLRGEDVEALGEATTANFFKLFPKAAGEA